MIVLSSPAQARIQAPAPKWEAEAVVEGKITKISLDDYKGLCLCFLLMCHSRRQVPRLLLLSPGLV